MFSSFFPSARGGAIMAAMKLASMPYWVMALVLLLVAGAATMAHSPLFMELGEEPDFWRPSPTRSAFLASLDEQRLRALPERAVWADLAKLYMEANLATAAARLVVERERFSPRSAGASELLRRFLSEHGEPAYVAVGTFLALKFRGHLAALVEKMAAEQAALPDWVPAHLDDPDLKATRALSGLFLENAHHAGLLVPDRDRMRVAQLLWFEHWLGAGEGGLPGEVLAAEERALVLAWKVEAAAHLPTERRLELLPVLSKLDPSYPGAYVSGVLLALAGRHEQALAAFQDCLDLGEMRLRAARWLLELRRAER
jgi:hypothetical protein